MDLLKYEQWKTAFCARLAIEYQDVAFSKSRHMTSSRINKLADALEKAFDEGVKFAQREAK